MKNKEMTADEFADLCMELEGKIFSTIDFANYKPSISLCVLKQLFIQVALASTNPTIFLEAAIKNFQEELAKHEEK